MTGNQSGTEEDNRLLFGEQWMLCYATLYLYLYHSIPRSLSVRLRRIRMIFSLVDLQNFKKQGIDYLLIVLGQSMLSEQFLRNA